MQTGNTVYLGLGLVGTDEDRWIKPGVSRYRGLLSWLFVLRRSPPCFPGEAEMGALCVLFCTEPLTMIYSGKEILLNGCFIEIELCSQITMNAGKFTRSNSQTQTMLSPLSSVGQSSLCPPVKNPS